MRQVRTARFARWAVLCALCAASPAAASIPEAVTSGTWCEVRSPHVRVLSDAGLERADHVAERIERLHERLLRTAPALAGETQARDVVFLFRSGATFRDYLPRYQGRPEEDTGLYQPSPGAGYLLLQDAPDPDLDPVALHEATHAIVHAAIPHVPLWLDEGLAQYFSTLKVDDDDARVGEPAPEWLAWLHGHARLPLADLLAMDATSPDYHEGERRLTVYAQSWLLVHMLLTESVAGQARFNRYLAALRRGEPSVSAFTDAFGDPTHLGWQLELYLQRRNLAGMNWSFAMPYSRMPVERHARVAAPDVLAALGSMLRWRPGDGVAAAREHARAALSRDPAHAGALALSLALDGPEAGAVPTAATQDSREDFDREQRAIGAFNTGVEAWEQKDPVRAVAQFREAMSLTRRPALLAKARESIALLRGSGEYAELAAVHELLQAGRRRAARQRTADLLSGRLNEASRRSLERLAAALDAALAAR
jgi:hypothetical protein